MSIKRAIVLASFVLAMTASAAFAFSPVGLSSSPLGRGTIDRPELREFIDELKRLRRPAQSDVALVKATLTAGGRTDWHGHTGPSVVIVTDGTIKLYEPAKRGRCKVTEYVKGDAFFHETSPHNFVNPSNEKSAEFLIAYFVPTGAAPLIPDGDPGGCAG